MQPQQFHALTHSFAQRRLAISFIFSKFRTLSIATGVGTPSVANSRFCLELAAFFRHTGAALWGATNFLNDHAH
jgi:hypothetical protein